MTLNQLLNNYVNKNGPSKTQIQQFKHVLIQNMFASYIIVNIVLFQHINEQKVKRQHFVLTHLI